MSKKTDNTSIEAKLALRRYFLQKYHLDEPPSVLDCCQGKGILWRRLQQEFTVADYWGVDEKPKRGRLRIDSIKILAQPGWPQNVVDVDTYGSPWKHWLAMLPNVSRPMTVFLTLGVGGPGRIRLGKPELLAMGMTMPSLLSMSGAITHPLNRLATHYCLSKADEIGLTIIEAMEAYETINMWSTRYIGVRLEPVYE